MEHLQILLILTLLIPYSLCVNQWNWAIPSSKVNKVNKWSPITRSSANPPCQNNTQTKRLPIENPTEAREARVEGRSLNSYSLEDPKLQLYNGTMLKRGSTSTSIAKGPVTNTILERNKSGERDLDLEEGPEEIDPRVIALNFKLSHPKHLKNKLALIKKPNLTTATTQTVTNLAQYPRVSMASLLKSFLFPAWLWKGGRMNFIRKVGLPSAPSGLTSDPGVEPSLSFDNNFSRFLRLFTKVRFDNSPCVSASGRNGTCYHPNECRALGGTSDTACAGGFGVCCFFEVTCGGVSSTNGTYFVGDDTSLGANGLRSCSAQILKASPLIKQMRLDFITFMLQNPITGTCDRDRFVVSGQNTNNIIPVLCGENSGQHLYVEVEGSSAGITLSVLTTTSEASRSWTILVTQFEANDHSTPPPYCLQYHSDIIGNVQSFNYFGNPDAQYLNNLNYAICIRKEAGYCSVTYTVNGADGNARPFEIFNAHDDGTPIIPLGQAGVGYRNCPHDYILLNGVRLCGGRLNDGSVSPIRTENAPVTDMSPGPFMVLVKTDERDISWGFSLFYRQNPCMSTHG